VGAAASANQLHTGFGHEFARVYSPCIPANKDKYSRPSISSAALPGVRLLRPGEGKVTARTPRWHRALATGPTLQLIPITSIFTRPTGRQKAFCVGAIEAVAVLSIVTLRDDGNLRLSTVTAREYGLDANSST